MDPSRFISLAFVASDLLLEIDGGRCVRFAIGAAAVAGEDAGKAYMNRSLDDVLGRASAWEFRKALGGLAPGRRMGPVEVLVACGDGRVRKASIRGFCLPELAPTVSLGLSWEGAPFVLAAEEAPLLSSEDFVDHARDALSEPAAPMAVAFVEVPGLTLVSDVMDLVAATLQSASMDGRSAARLSDDRFAVLRAEDDGRDLGDMLRTACAAENVSIDPVVSQASVRPDGDPNIALRALRFAIAECIAEGPAKSAGGFSTKVAQTLKDAEEFKRIARDQTFQVHFQPIVDLASGAVHHHEVLARFPGRQTQDLIRMAEELDLIRAFDLAVLDKSIKTLRQPGAGLAKLAINVSGVSLTTDDYLQALLRKTSLEPADRKRLMIEITETAELEDTAAARGRLERIRAVGIKVCIDDFGAGAASYEYLRTMPIDVVKLDGRLARSVLDDDKSRAMVAHLVELCRSMNVRTVAEHVETQELADRLRDLGVDMGQGWHFGRPGPDLTTRVGPAAARRSGEVEAWG